MPRSDPGDYDGKQLVCRYYELVDQGDVSGLLELFAPDATYYRPGYPPIAGRSALAEFYRDTRVIAEGRHRLHVIIQSGPQVAVRGGFVGVLRDGREVGLEFADFFVLGSDRRFTERRTFFFTPLV